MVDGPFQSPEGELDGKRLTPAEAAVKRAYGRFFTPLLHRVKSWPPRGAKVEKDRARTQRLQGLQPYRSEPCGIGCHIHKEGGGEGGQAVAPSGF